MKTTTTTLATISADQLSTAVGGALRGPGGPKIFKSDVPMQRIIDLVADSVRRFR